MPSRHYDVIVLGRSIGALTTAALLARRDLSVLVLGQGQRPALYHVDGHLVCRRTFSFLAATSPCFKRCLLELAQSQRFKRHTQLLNPMFVVLGPGRRVQVPPDIELFEREIDREFPEVRQLVDEVYAIFAEVNAAADAAFERDAIWPPEKLLERVETGRIASALPFKDRDDTDILSKFPAGHPYREVIALPARFATHLATPNERMPAFALARLHGAWTRGVQALIGGESELEHYLVERIRAHGGIVDLDARADRIAVKHGRAVGIIEEGAEEATGASHLVCSYSGEAVADLARGAGLKRNAIDDWPRLTASAGRFVVSLAVERAGLPEALSHESFFIPERPGPRRPFVHAQLYDAAQLEAGQPEGRALLVAETLLPTRGPLTLLEARQAVLSTLREHLPFLDEHIVLIDSVHDGLPAQRKTPDGLKDIERIHIPESAPVAEAMEWQWTVEPAGFFDLGGERVRGPIKETYLVGPTVLPALGQEGELLAAWSAARLITKGDRARQKMRRQLWTKIETN